MLSAMNRRHFLAAAAASGASALLPSRSLAAEVDRALAAPVLVTDFVKDPIKIASIELLRNGRDYFLRTRSTNGLEVITVPNPARMTQTYPIAFRNIIPTFIGKTDQFWYSVRTPNGTKYYRVDPAHKVKDPLFDVAKLAAQLSELVQVRPRPARSFSHPGPRHSGDPPGRRRANRNGQR